MNYLDMLKDPRWQKKRLRILKRDKFRCRECGDHESTLHVHHLFYQKGLAPWEYENRFLLTLCEQCHKEYHGQWILLAAELVCALTKDNPIMPLLHGLVEENKTK